MLIAKFYTDKICDSYTLSEAIKSNIPEYIWIWTGKSRPVDGNTDILSHPCP